MRKFPADFRAHREPPSAHPIQASGLLRGASEGLCSSAHPRQPKTGEYLLRRRRPAVLKSALTLFAAIARRTKLLPLFRPASIERDLEETLCLVRCCRQQREKAAARRRLSTT